MKYTAEIWFGDVSTQLVLEDVDGKDAEAVLAVAEQITERLGGDYCSVHCWED